MNIESINIEGQSPQQPKPAELVVGVQFKTAGKIYSFLTTDPSLKTGDQVLVEADDGMSVGWIINPPREFEASHAPKNLKRVLHRATQKEIEEAALRREKAMEYFDICKKKIAEHSLQMKMIDAEIVEGGKKVIFFFFAEERVDFRSLVKDLASSLHMRIEMRQVGSRDESKLLGCIGPCGLVTCCSSHMRQFQSISISMAKNQGLTPNPAKLTGMCGKLKCCLAYEQEAYAELRQGLPKLGAAVESPKGAGKIVDLNILKRDCSIQLYGGGMDRCPCKDLKILSKDEKEKAITAIRTAEPPEDRSRDRRRSNDKRMNRNNRDRKHVKKG
ncbi:MAG TPA: regulatory iron-sulfur-containing complex subunit RicT [bacterium]|nr:regulatory iron-sulfur-containing complex subunit RicT [bacterium]HQC50836.1 regulatory iron-sulfur-containing complex subunit RicT [bacterium]